MSVSREELRQQIALAVSMALYANPIIGDEDILIAETVLAVPGVAAALRLADAVEATPEKTPGKYDSYGHNRLLDRLRSVLSEPT